MALQKLCFILVERDKANKLRRHFLSKFYTAEKNFKKSSALDKTQRLKSKTTSKWMKEMSKHHADYRRVADLMNDQRPLLRQLRKEAKVTKISYNGSNYCRFVLTEGNTLNLKQIQENHNTYVFETTLLGDAKLENPYAKELYGKETKQEAPNSSN